MGAATRLAVELSEGRARAVALEEGPDGFRLRWYGSVEEESGPEPLARALRTALARAGVEPDDAAVATPPSLGAAYRALRLPRLRGDELETAVRAELGRELGGEELEEMVVRAWQGESATRRTNTLCVALPRRSVAYAEAFATGLRIPVVALLPPAVVLHHGLLAQGALAAEGATGILYAGHRFGFAAYVRGDAWILIHHFALHPDSEESDRAETVVQEVRQSFTFLRSRAPEEELRKLILSGRGLPRAGLAAGLEGAVPDVSVEEYAFGPPLAVDGIPHAGGFVREQSGHAVALLLAAETEGMPLDFRSQSLRLPGVRRRVARRAGASAGIAAAAVALLAVVWWVQGSRAEGRRAAALEELAAMRPRLETVRRQERIRDRLAALGRLRALERQQGLLGPAALRELSVAVVDGITVDTLAWSLSPGGLSLTLSGGASGPTPTESRNRLQRFVAALERSPVFASAEVPRQDAVRSPDGAFRVRFTVRGRLTGGRSGEEGP